MAHASSTGQREQIKSTTRRDFERCPSYSEHFYSGCVRTLVPDLNRFVAEFKDCLCHQNRLDCPLSKERHELLGRILHVFQDACNLSGSAGSISNSRRPLTRQQSVDSSKINGTSRPLFADQSSSESSESGYSSQSSDDGSCTCSLDNEPNFVIKEGYLLIINNVWFHGRCCPRNGTTAEGGRMQRLFESFGFRVEIVFNYTTDNIRQILKNKATDISMKNYDCFALLMLSHGAEDGILGADNKQISYREIMDMVKADKFPAMGGKPKLIFSQACRGITHDPGYLLGRGGSDIRRDCGKRTPETVLRVPTDSNILIVYATTPGRMAYKHTDYKYRSDADAHSWFLDALCQVLCAHADKEDLLSMLTRVNNHVAILGDEDSGMQIPSQFSTLTRKVFLIRRSEIGH